MHKCLGCVKNGHGRGDAYAQMHTRYRPPAAGCQAGGPSFLTPGWSTRQGGLTPAAGLAAATAGPHLLWLLTGAQRILIRRLAAVEMGVWRIRRDVMPGLRSVVTSGEVGREVRW